MALSRFKKFQSFFFIRIVLAALFSESAYCTTFVVEEQSKWVGTPSQVTSHYGETLEDIGIRYDMGIDEMVRANHGMDPDALLVPGTKITVPSRFLLPKGVHQGIIVNLATYRLFYFPADENIVMTFPVGVGRKRWETPMGQTKVVAKIRNPSWHPSKKLQQEGKKQGVFVPDYFPPARENPLGQYALQLGWPTYLIHGTNQKGGVGKKVSAGCIRMLSQDIEYLFDYVKIGTSVRVVYEPVTKMGKENNHRTAQ